jgi:hypothetical protein
LSIFQPKKAEPKMSEQPSISQKSEPNPRTARAVTAILSQTREDELLRELNSSDGRNQSEQASFLATESTFLRDVYERGGTAVAGGVVIVPKENLSLPPELEIATTRAAVERLVRITKDEELAKELAPQFVEMGERIAGPGADSETRLKVFGWLYRTLEGKQELFEKDAPENSERDLQLDSETQFAEKWQQIVELSEMLAELEPKDRLPENSVESLGENIQENESAFERDENWASSEIYETAEEREISEQSEEFVSGGALIGFERIEAERDLPKIPEHLSQTDFEKLLEKMSDVDSQLEQGVSTREILAPFKRYVDATKLDNELRLVEEEYVKVLSKTIGGYKEAAPKYRFIAGRENLRELAEDKRKLVELQKQKETLGENIQKNFSGSVDRTKVERSIDGQINKSVINSDGAKPEKIELTEDEKDLRQILVKEKNIASEIDRLLESINDRENNFRPFAELAAEKISVDRKNQLIEKVAALELPSPSVLKEKYPELTAQERREKLTDANTFEIQNPAEYLFVKEAANRQFQTLRTREIKNEYRKFENKNVLQNSDGAAARRELNEHREKIRTLKTIEPDFTYKIEGSSRIIKAEPSERALAGYLFASEYIRYQLKQPETSVRRKSAVYREYAARLETAKTSQDVVAEAYKIRQENHQAAAIWKNANPEQRRKLERPLSKNQMTLLFLEQPVRSYTGEMSYLKYGFAHYSEAKQRMTAALENGSLQPSAEAERLVQSLEERLARRDLETKRKATKHFFESLITENEKLFIKNEFDHRAAYQNLPPHEKDWIYARASHQKENLEYKIAYERQKNSVRDAGGRNEPIATNEAATNLRQEFAAGTLWHQAAEFNSQKEAKNFERGAAIADEKTLQAIGFLIHNQPQANSLRVADWLEKQKSEELKTAGEILKTFALATRQIESNQLTVTVKIAETTRVTVADYKNLFERYFPADFEKVKEFRAHEGEKFRLEQSRRMGQSAMLDAWSQDAQTAVYREDAPARVFENELGTVEEVEKIKQWQTHCRRASEVKNAILTKYEEKLKKDFGKSGLQISGDDLRAAVEQAFAPDKSETLSGEQKAIFQKAQNKILYSDFERFAESSSRIEKGLDEIRRSFEKIAALRFENSQYMLAPEKTLKTESLQTRYETIQKQSQAEQITKVARAKFAAKTIGEVGSVQTTLIDNLSSEERQQARTQSHRQARIALEPAELEKSDQSAEVQAKALEFADALEKAHQASLRGFSESDTAKAFTVAEIKRMKLREFLKPENQSRILPENKPVSLLIYERELGRCEKAIAQAKIAEMVETGKLSLADIETKKASEIFSPKEREEIRIEAGERTRENLEPKELWAKRHSVSEKLEQSALRASEALEQAHEIYHQSGAEAKEVTKAFSSLDAGIIALKSERRKERLNAKFINFKTDFKRDLGTVFESEKSSENPRLLAAMTKGLLIDGLEKQDMPPEKIGIGFEKLSEISLTISMAMISNKKREQFSDKNFELPHKTRTNELSERDNPASRQTEFEKQHVQAKPKQFERAR